MIGDYLTIFIFFSFHAINLTSSFIQFGLLFNSLKSIQPSTEFNIYYFLQLLNRNLKNHYLKKNIIIIFNKFCYSCLHKIIILIY
jgi:hypothetical protein